MPDPAPFPLAGEAFSTLAAMVWALAFVLFKWCGETIPPLALNLFKNVLAIPLFTITILIVGKTQWKAGTLEEYTILIISGIIGIAAADTLLFAGLNRLGAGLTAIVECMWAPIVAVCAYFYLGERLSTTDAFGGALIIAGILLGTVKFRGNNHAWSGILPGVLLAASAVLLMAIGIVIAKPILDRSPVLWVTQVRLVAGTLALALLCLFTPSMRTHFKHFRPRRSWRVSVPASILGSYLAMAVWVAGMKYTLASVAAILNQFHILFVIVFAAIILHEPLGARKLAAVGLGVIGAIIVNLY
ncbi:DMT family transporter [Acidobacteriota bacterium]